jgi:hypothetical protein
MGSSALKNTHEEKSWYEKAYDKASQVGMGIKNAYKHATSEKASHQRMVTGNDINLMDKYREGRDKEKKHDDGASDLAMTKTSKPAHNKAGTKPEKK